MRPSTRLLAHALLVAWLWPAPAPAAGGRPLGKGDQVRVDLSRVPASVVRRGQASCTGNRRLGTGEWEEVACQRTFTFEVPYQGDPVVLVFQPKGPGSPVRLEYPATRDPRPKLFTAPAAGTLLQPPPPERPAPAGEEKMPAPLEAQARAAASRACELCPADREYRLKDFTVEPAKVPPPVIAITVQPAG